MSESNYSVHVHLRKPEDYHILSNNSQEDQMVIKTEQGDLILTIDRKIALKIAMDLVKAVAVCMKQEVSKEL